jgi:hypothetical protein
MAINKRAQTMDLKGNEYARVPERIRLFREDCPSGKIITKHEVNDKGETIFKSYVWKDKRDVKYSDNGQVILDSADSNGTAKNTVKGDKDFEKLETISIGRGLAILGYLASGEVASGEEMEEYYREKEERDRLAAIQHREQVVDNLRACLDLDTLRDTFVHSGLTNDPEIVRRSKTKSLNQKRKRNQ